MVNRLLFTKSQLWIQFFTQWKLKTVPLPLGCRDPPGLADVGAVAVGGVACDVGMIVSMPWVTGGWCFFFLVVLITHSLCKWFIQLLWSHINFWSSFQTQEAVLQAHFFKKSPFGDLQLQNGPHKKILLPKTNKCEGEDTSWQITRRKKHEGEDTSWRITRRTNLQNGTLATLYFAAVSLRIHVEFLKDERGKE